MSIGNNIPAWLDNHRMEQPFAPFGSSAHYVHEPEDHGNITLTDVAFNKHSVNDGEHVSPTDNGDIYTGTAGLQVKLVQGVDQELFKAVLSSATRATVGLAPDGGDDDRDWEEMMRGGLQSALETQSIVFQVFNASRTLTHQLVRSRSAAFHQQSQRATWYGDRPDVRMPLSVWKDPVARAAFQKAAEAAWDAYQVACDRDISYQDARFILPEGTVNFIQCTYTVREFINVFAYRGCSMFMWEMVDVMRKMRTAILEQSPWLEPYVKISCEKTGTLCNECGGAGDFNTEWSDAAEKSSGLVVLSPPEGGTALVQCPKCNGQGRIGAKCTFQGWESPEGQCDKPWAKDEQRSFKPLFHTIGKRPGLK
ncbi:thymidylate synthase [Streptomyces phage phiRKBJ001]|nr:thymidylate synthase [Streptomyces phage phiRKBJ001]